MSLRFEHDFSRVRVHSGTDAGALADSLHARAYTVGPHMVFGRSRYAPHQSEGRALLAHELTHVVQQERAGLRAVQCQDARQPIPTAGRGPGDPEVALGTRLVQGFASGVPVAFYAPMPWDGEVAKSAAEKWATRESAVGLKGKAVIAANVLIGSAAEFAPVHPVEVGSQIKTYWSTTYWPGHQGAAINRLRQALLATKRAKKT
jgi:hypothetical protein